mgnify:CR=1 FL=1
MAKKEGNETPLMQQYYATKAKYPDAILLYRMKHSGQMLSPLPESWVLP